MRNSQEENMHKSSIYKMLGWVAWPDGPLHTPLHSGTPGGGKRLVQERTPVLGGTGAEEALR